MLFLALLLATNLSSFLSLPLKLLSVSFSFAAMYGIAVAALGMLSTIATGLAIDTYGPISDNAGGIAEMASMSHWIRERTDVLDAAGNTTAAIGKMGGRNTALLDALRWKIPLVSDIPMIIFGADVTHPESGEDCSPSIAAVSIKNLFVTYKDPDRPKNYKASILSDTIQMLKDLTAQVSRLKFEYAALTGESRELTQEKNDLREEKASLKSNIESLNAQYQQSEEKALKFHSKET